MNSVTIEHIESLIVNQDYINNGKTTICTLSLVNGYQVTGTSGVVDASKFDVGLGEKYAREKAIEGVWPLEGYLLQQRRFDEQQAKEAYVMNFDPFEPGVKFSFGVATILAKQGYRVARSGWDGKGMYIYYVPADSYPARTASAKAEFGENGLVPYGHYWAMKTAQGNVVPWLASQTDMLDEDWIVLANPEPTLE